MTEPAMYAHLPRAVSPVDRVVTMVLVFGLVMMTPVACHLGVLTWTAANDACMGGSTCDSTIIGVGVATSALSPVVVTLAAVAWVIVRWVHQRSTWWLPVAALVVGAALWGIGAAITFSTVG